MRGSLKILYPVMWQLLHLFLFEFVNWNSGNVFCAPYFFMRHGVFFAIAPLPVLQSYCDKIAITHMFVMQLGFSQSQHISGLQPHCQGYLQSPVFSPSCNHIKQRPI
jgi:hypothetical protein